jgi:hypothetical protein
MQDGSELAALRSSLSSCGSLCVLLELLIVVFRLTRDAMLTFSLKGPQGQVQVTDRCSPTAGIRQKVVA